jgi:hypothetical protein
MESRRTLKPPDYLVDPRHLTRLPSQFCPSPVPRHRIPAQQTQPNRPLPSRHRHRAEGLPNSAWPPHRESSQTPYLEQSCKGLRFQKLRIEGTERLMFHLKLTTCQIGCEEAVGETAMIARMDPGQTVGVADVKICRACDHTPCEWSDNTRTDALVTSRPDGLRGRFPPGSSAMRTRTPSL